MLLGKLRTLYSWNPLVSVPAVQFLRLAYVKLITYVSIYLSMYLSFFLSTYICNSACIHLFICPSFFISIHLSITFICNSQLLPQIIPKNLSITKNFWPLLFFRLPGIFKKISYITIEIHNLSLSFIHWFCTVDSVMWYTYGGWDLFMKCLSFR